MLIQPDFYYGLAVTSERPTAEAITAVIADRVREFRRQAGMTQTELADEMNRKFGIPWTRGTVINLEKRSSASRGHSGGRDVVTAQELLCLAMTLGVSPMALLADPRRSDEVDLGGAKWTQWDFVGWLAGRTRLRAEPDRAGNRERWESSRRPIVLIERYWEAVNTLQNRLTSQLDAMPLELSNEYDLISLTQIARSLELAREAGIVLPAVPEHVRARAKQLGYDDVSEVLER